MLGSNQAFSSCIWYPVQLIRLMRMDQPDEIHICMSWKGKSYVYEDGSTYNHFQQNASNKNNHAKSGNTVWKDLVNTAQRQEKCSFCIVSNSPHINFAPLFSKIPTVLKLADNHVNMILQSNNLNHRCVTNVVIIVDSTKWLPDNNLKNESLVKYRISENGWKITPQTHQGTFTQIRPYSATRWRGWGSGEATFHSVVYSIR